MASGALRARLRVFLGKNFFSYRYDYREEWLAFTAMLASNSSPQEVGVHIVRALARRHLGVARSLIEFGSLSFDTAHRECRVAGQRLALSVRELSVLEMLMVRAGKVVTKQQIVQGLSALDSDFSENAVEVYIYRLRKRLEGTGAAIQTVRGFGYLLEIETA